MEYCLNKQFGVSFLHFAVCNMSTVIPFDLFVRIKPLEIQLANTYSPIRSSRVHLSFRFHGMWGDPTNPPLVFGRCDAFSLVWPSVAFDFLNYLYLFPVLRFWNFHRPPCLTKRANQNYPVNWIRLLTRWENEWIVAIWMVLTSRKTPFFPNNEIVVPPMMVTWPAPAQSNMVMASIAVRGNSLNKCGKVTHSFQLKFACFNWVLLCSRCQMRYSFKM